MFVRLNYGDRVIKNTYNNYIFKTQKFYGHIIHAVNNFRSTVIVELEYFLYYISIKTA